LFVQLYTPIQFNFNMNVCLMFKLKRLKCEPTLFEQNTILGKLQSATTAQCTVHTYRSNIFKNTNKTESLDILTTICREGTNIIDCRTTLSTPTGYYVRPTYI